MHQFGDGVIGEYTGYLLEIRVGLKKFCIIKRSLVSQILLWFFRIFKFWEMFMRVMDIQLTSLNFYIFKL